MFDSLPNELIFSILRYLSSFTKFTIFSYLDKNSLCALSATSRYFFQLSRTDMLWKSLCENHFGVSILPEKSMPWFLAFKVLKRIRCVHCGKRGEKSKNHASRLLGIVLCSNCRNLPQYGMNLILTMRKTHSRYITYFFTILNQKIPSF